MSKTQNNIVLSYLRKRHNSKKTNEQIRTGLKAEFNFTSRQVSKCLERLSGKNMVKRTSNPSGITATGRKAYCWYYNPAKIKS